MGKKRKTGKKEGVLLVLLVLFCTFLTGCDLLDIKDGGLGMTNPDYVGTGRRINHERSYGIPGQLLTGIRIQKEADSWA